MNNWDIYKAASELKQEWGQRTIWSGMRIVGKGHTTRAVFATDVRFDSLRASEEAATTQDNAGSRKRVATDGPQRPRNRVEPKEDYENRQAFDNRMKDITFAEKTKKIREARQITKELTENAEAC